MASLTAPGIGSGLDINSLVTQLLEAESAAPVARLNTRETDLQVQLTGYGLLRGSLSGLQSSLSSLQNPATFQGRTVSSSDASVVAVTANGQVTAGDYDINITNIAESHKLATDPTLVAAQFTDITDELGTGTLTFRFGTDPDQDPGFVQNPDRATETVEITDGSLQGVRDAINDADIGVTASLIFDGDFYRLAITSDTTGEENAIQITVDDDDTFDDNDSGLSLLSFNGTSTNIEQTDAAVDAAFSVNGIGITSSSNTVDDAIEDVTLTLQDAGTANVGASLDRASIGNAVTAFVSSYNSFIDTLNTQTNFNPDTGEAGALNGDAITRGIATTVRRLVSNPVGEVGDSLTILAEIGITTDSNTGRLEYDNAVFNQQLTDNFDRFVSLFSAFGVPSESGVSFVRSRWSLFSAFGVPSESGVSFVSATDDTTVGDYAVNITTAASRGDLVGSAAANLTIVADTNDSLDFSIDGVDATITLSANTYTASELASELQAQINNTAAFSNAGISVRVTESVGVLSITSQSYGSISSVDITGGNGQTDLVGAGATSTDGVDVVGTIGGLSATGVGQLLTGTGNAAGLTLEITGNTLGARGTVDFNRGYADRLGSYLDTLLESNGLLSSTTDSLQSQIESVAADRITLADRLDSLETRLRNQFTALDVLISNLQSTSSFLTSQLDSLPEITIRRSN